jgi:hypothetical protein
MTKIARGSSVREMTAEEAEEWERQKARELAQEARRTPNPLAEKRERFSAWDKERRISEWESATGEDGSDL